MAHKKRPPRQPGEAKRAPKVERPKPEPKVEESTFQEPIHRAMGMERVPGGWCMCTYVIQGKNVIEVIRTQPDVKNVTLEKYKIAFVNEFVKE